MRSNLFKTARIWLLAASAVLLTACGGGSDEPLTAQQAANAMKAVAKPPAAAIPRREANATSEVIAARVFAFAEAHPVLTNLFPPGPQTQQAGPFLYRYYPTTGFYLGVVVVAGAGYELNNIYVLGNQFGMDLANPFHAGPASNYVDVTDGQTGGGNLTLDITVNLGMYGTFSYSFPNLPAPNTQETFCSGLANDTTFNQISQIPGFSGSLVINNCSYSGNTGTISATLTVVMPPLGQIVIPYTVTYTYH